MKKFRWILLCAALLAAALFALWRLPALFVPSVPAALTYTPPDDETVSAVRAAVQDRFGSDGAVYLLPDCEIDAVSLEYRPLSDPNLGGARWVLLRSDSGASSLFLYSVRWDSFTEITDQSENGFDPSLGKSLTDCATSHGCTPLFLLSIGQRWLVSRDADGALFACGPLSADDPEIAWLSEAEFLQKHWPYASGALPLPTGAQVQLQ